MLFGVKEISVIRYVGTTLESEVGAGFTGCSELVSPPLTGGDQGEGDPITP